MTFRDGWLDWAEKVPAHPGRVGGPISPKYLVWHCTDTPFGTGRTIVRSWHEGPGAGNCAHFVIEADGHVTQLIPVTRNGNHAGGKDHGTINGQHPNINTVGVELVNPGLGYGDLVTKAEPGLGGRWTPYTDRQLYSAKYLAIELARDVLPPYSLTSLVTVKRPVDRHDLDEVVQRHPLGLRHYDINPIQKTDPGPLFPVDEVVAVALKGAIGG